MRTCCLGLLLAILMFPAAAEEGNKETRKQGKKVDKKEDKEKSEFPKKAAKMKLLMVLCRTKTGFKDTAAKHRFTLYLLRGHVLEFVGKEELNNEKWFTGRTMTGEMIMVQPQHVNPFLRALKYPSEKRQRSLYMWMARAEKMAAARARKKGSHASMLQYWTRKFYHQNTLQLARQYTVTQSMWQRIKARGKKEGWKR